MVQLASHNTLFPSSPRMASESVLESVVRPCAITAHRSLPRRYELWHRPYGAMSTSAGSYGAMSTSAGSYGAMSTWRQAAGRSAILGPGRGGDGGAGLG